MLLDKELARGENEDSARCIGPEAEEMAGRLEQGQTLLLETCVSSRGRSQRPQIRKQLAGLADYYVNDALAQRTEPCVHSRRHYFVQKRRLACSWKRTPVPGQSAAPPERPFIAILGAPK
jgi:3-phosphoglycerate kinase